MIPENKNLSKAIAFELACRSNNFDGQWILAIKNGHKRNKKGKTKKDWHK